MNCPIIILLLLTSSLSVGGQQEAPAPPVAAKPKPAPEQVYTYVEQMPQLPGGGGMAAVGAEFQRRFRLPSLSPADDVAARAQLYFEVNPSGRVQHIRLLQSTRAQKVDSALVAAIRALPTFTPGLQHGRPVTVGLTLPISCIKYQF